MKDISISDDAYQALANRYGDVAAYLEVLADQAKAESKPERSFADAMRDSGLLGCIRDAPENLSSNPTYLDGFGR